MGSGVTASGAVGSNRLMDGMFIVTILAMVFVEAALLMGRIEGALYAGLMTAAVGGFMALGKERA